MHGKERRHFSRVPVSRCAMLDGPGGERAVKVEDVSLKGVLLQLPPGDIPARTARYRLTLRLSSAAAIEMELTLAHCEGGRAGFYCRRIDLESISHLRRLVELHLGDAALLRRELGELAAAPPA